MAHGSLPGLEASTAKVDGAVVPTGTTHAGTGRAASYLRALPPLLLVLALALAYWAVAEARSAARTELQQQQLATARSLATRLEADLSALRLDLASVAAAIAESPAPAADLPQQLRGSLLRGSGLALLEVRYANALNGRATYLRQRGRVADEAFTATDLALLGLPQVVGGANPAVLLAAPAAQAPQLALATAVETDGAFAGVLYYLLDARQLAASVTTDARVGGATVWVADGAGELLAHPLRDLVGSSLFEGKGDRPPPVAFAQNEATQRQRLLSGQEGATIYLSSAEDAADERARERLAAYAPARLGGEGAQGHWVVGVASAAGDVGSTSNTLLWRLLAACAPLLAGAALAFALFLGGYQRRLLDLQHAAEAARLRLLHAQQRQKAIADACDDLILTLDEDGRVLQANRAATRLLAAALPARYGQRQPEEVVGRHIQHLLPAGGDYLRTEAAGTLRERRAATREHALTVGNEERWYRTKLRPLADGDAPPTVLAVSRDLTQKRQLEEHLGSTERLAALGILATGVAHEINNPLTSILGYTDLLLEQHAPESAEYQDLKTIERCGQHCRDVVENLLDYARIGTNLGETTDLNQAVENVLELVASLLLANKITVERHLAADLPLLPANPFEVRQVLLNLANNAIQAMEGGGTLSVATAQRAKRLMVSVGDSGRGIPPEARQHIFTPFFTTHRPGEATGLGLSVSLGLVRKLSGTITFTTSTGNPQTGELSGSVFTVILPLPAKEASQSEPA